SLPEFDALSGFDAQPGFDGVQALPDQLFRERVSAALGADGMQMASPQKLRSECEQGRRYGRQS
ncbi:MAG: hypothetical protein J0626_04955, partial [Rhodospirillaceae bacterium]|nr:hypothetical protein [Rhodospirillaceae bacterium]